MNQKQKIKNSIRAYVMGDALGVPFEFKSQGSFKCMSFVGFGTHCQKPGTWSDDTSILLCLLNALSLSKDIVEIKNIYKKNLLDWFYKGKFTVGGIFDIGSQTSEAILSRFEQKRDRPGMGNGALFYSLPLALNCLKRDLDKSTFSELCKVTHDNDNCFNFGWKLSLLVKNLVLSLPIEKYQIQEYSNKGDVINTFYLVLDQFSKFKDRDSSLFQDLCEAIDLGKDTDTNAAFLGMLLGIKKEVEKSDWEMVRNHRYIDKQIDIFLNSLELIE